MFVVDWPYGVENFWLIVFLSLAPLVVLFWFNRKNFRNIFSFHYVLMVSVSYLLLSYYLEGIFRSYFPESDFYLPGLLLSICLIGLFGAICRIVKNVAIIGLWLAMIFFIMSPFISKINDSPLMVKVTEIGKQTEDLISNYPELGTRMKASAGKIQEFWRLMST